MWLHPTITTIATNHMEHTMIIRELMGPRCWETRVTRNTQINELLASAILRDMYYDSHGRMLVAPVELIDALRDAGMTVVGGEGQDYLESQQ